MTIEEKKKKKDNPASVVDPKIEEQLLKRVARDLNLNLEGVRATSDLLADGATIPFLARYRKEATRGLDEDQLRQVEKRLNYERQLSARKLEILASIEEQGKLTPELSASITRATILQEIKDLYLPFRPRRRTRATVAREKGLEPLADLIMAQQTFRGKQSDHALEYVNPEKGVVSIDEALAGARDIVAERVADDAELRRRLRALFLKEALLTSTITKEGKAHDEGGKYVQYYEYSEPFLKIPPHRLLALNRAEKEDVLRISLSAPFEEGEHVVNQLYVHDERALFASELKLALVDSLKRLLFPSLENELRTHFTESAEAHAIKIFAANVRQLLLQPPIQGNVVLALDPGFRTGCKVAVVDPTGKPLQTAVIYPHDPKRDWNGAQRILLELIKRYKVTIIAIGNGTASRETEVLAAEVIALVPSPKPAYVMVSEAGASVYSASELARHEFPDLDVTERGTISIARRLQDPLAELVKIDPKSIGVGLYQHDVNQKELGQSLDAVVESCVNYVGVELNTASAELLKHVSGVTRKVAEAIVAHREEHGPFKTRKELRKVGGLGARAFEQAAGFLKIVASENPLDNTFIHPESYEAATKLLEVLNVQTGSTKKTGKKSIISLPSQSEIKEFRFAYKEERRLEELALKLGIGSPTLRDILDNLEKPGRDPREELPRPILRQDILKMEDLTPGMILKGTVRNVIDFGAFVDIGVKQDGLVHITEMSDRFIRHPLDVVSVGDIVDVRVLQINSARGRIGLSLKLNPAK